MAEYQLAVLMLEWSFIWTPGPALRSSEASVALRTSSGSRRRSRLKLKQVEGEQEHAGVGAPIAETIERRQPIITAGDRLAVNQAGPHPERIYRAGDHRIALRRVIAAPG
jgi:hypothetical protein